jgi:hypothetical protein
MLTVRVCYLISITRKRERLSSAMLGKWSRSLSRESTAKCHGFKERSNFRVTAGEDASFENKAELSDATLQKAVSLKLEKTHL